MTDHRLREIERALFAPRPSVDLALAWLREHLRMGRWPELLDPPEASSGSPTSR